MVAMILCQLLNLQASRFTFRHIDFEREVLTFKLESRLKQCRCANTTLIHLTAHKFYCRNPLCPQKVFTERFNEGIAPYKRMTKRLSELLCSLTLQLSGRNAERLCGLLHIEVSDTTLGRLLYKHPLLESITPKVLGVDDLGQ